MKKNEGKYSMVTCSECGITFQITPEKEGRYVSNYVSNELSSSILLFNGHVCEHCYEEIVARQSEKDEFIKLHDNLKRLNEAENGNEALKAETNTLLESEPVRFHGFYIFHDMVLRKGIFNRCSTQFYPVKEIVTVNNL